MAADDDSVRAAANRRTPPKPLARLSADPEPDVREAAVAVLHTLAALIMSPATLLERRAHTAAESIVLPIVGELHR